jgi:hypothetical protein
MCMIIRQDAFGTQDHCKGLFKVPASDHHIPGNEFEGNFVARVQPIQCENHTWPIHADRLIAPL